MTKSKQQKNAILTIVCLLALAVFGAAMVWLHYQQLCSPGGGDDPYTSDLGQHLYFAQQGMIYSTVSLLLGPAYDIAGRIGIAVLLAVFHLAAVAVFAWGLRAALPVHHSRGRAGLVRWGAPGAVPAGRVLPERPA